MLREHQRNAEITNPRPNRPWSCILAQLTARHPTSVSGESCGQSCGAVVIMGVAGCGKSTLGKAVAQRLGWSMLEGDDFHSDENKARMRTGVPLNDADREGWLRRLAIQLQAHKCGVVLTCSALKRAYRESLRAALPELKFVFLDISYEEALRRVRARSEHFFPPNLMQSQFEALERPVNESGVLRLDAALPLENLLDQTVQWLTAESRLAG